MVNEQMLLQTQSFGLLVWWQGHGDPNDPVNPGEGRGKCEASFEMMGHLGPPFSWAANSSRDFRQGEVTSIPRDPSGNPVVQPFC